MKAKNAPKLTYEQRVVAKLEALVLLRMKRKETLVSVFELRDLLRKTRRVGPKS